MNPPPQSGGGISPEFLLFVLLLACVYMVPTMIAYWRGHGYKHVIFALNVIGGITGLGWIIAIIWAAWPNDKSLIDPVMGNVTGKGYRNAGDTLGAATFGTGRGFHEEREAYHAQRRSQAKNFDEPDRLS